MNKQRWLPLLARHLTPGDRWLLLTTALAIGTGIFLPLLGVASHARVAMDNQPIMRLNLHQDGEYTVQGRLGPITIEVQKGRVRLLEYDSPRMIGTRSGWISGTGQVIACVPCGVVIQVEGGGENGYDAMTR